MSLLATISKPVCRLTLALPYKIALNLTFLGAGGRIAALFIAFLKEQPLFAIKSAKNGL
jgi:hypothetical protein